MSLAPGPIGVVTVTYNSVSLLDDFIASLEQQTCSIWHAYIIDNESKDDTVGDLRRRNLSASRYTVIGNDSNVGVAAGNNQGIVLALEQGCEWVLLINNDTAFPKELLETLLRQTGQHGWRVVVPKIYFNFPPCAIWYAGGGFDAKKGHTGFHAGINEIDYGQFDTARAVEYSPTCCMLIHRTVFDEIGLMDESYFAYFDDTDFCWRLKAAGVAIGYAPEATLVHKVGGSTGGSASAFFARLTARNRLYFLRKHFGRWSPLRWLPVFIFYYIFRYLLKSWNPAAFRASIEGTLLYRRMREATPALPAAARSESR